MTMLPFTAPWTVVTSPSGGGTPHPTDAEAKSRESIVHCDRVIRVLLHGTEIEVDRSRRPIATCVPPNAPGMARRIRGISLAKWSPPPHEEVQWTTRPWATAASGRAGDLQHDDTVARHGRRRVRSGERSEIGVAPEIANRGGPRRDAERAPLNGDRRRRRAAIEERHRARVRARQRL